MNTLNIAPKLQLPIDIASQATCLFGIRGSGKTNTAGALAEELLDHHSQIVVIDPTDAWWGLRAGIGDRPGYQVFIFGGSHADLPLQETDGRIIAEFIVREQVPVILSLRHLRKGAQRRFVTEFCEELYHLKGKDEFRTPLTVFIDEAPLFVPQKVLGEVARTVGAVEDLIARGRNAGFGVVLISQRSATLNADVRTQADTIICHRVTAPLDRKAIAEWFEQNASVDDLKSILQSLATLRNGEAWAWAPSLGIMQRVQVRLRRTFDSSATPKAGAKILPPRKLADVDIEKLKGQLAASIEAAKNDDPKELRKRIQSLELELKHTKAGPPAAVVSAATEAVRQRAKEEAAQIWEGERQEFNAMLGRLRNAFADIQKDVDHFQSRPRTIVDEARVHHDSQILDRLNQSSGGRRSTLIVDLSKNPPASVNQNSDLTNPERRILTVLAQYPNGKPLETLAPLSGYTVNGHFNNTLGSLRAKGYAEKGSPVRITADGLAALGEFEPLPTGVELQRYWLGKLTNPEQRILTPLLQAYPRGLVVDELAAAAGYTVNGHFNNVLGSLRTKDLVQRGSPIKAAEVFFE